MQVCLCCKIKNKPQIKTIRWEHGSPGFSTKYFKMEKRHLEVYNVMLFKLIWWEITIFNRDAVQKNNGTKPLPYLWLMKSNSWEAHRLLWPAQMTNDAAVECSLFRSGTNCLLISAVRQGKWRGHGSRKRGWLKRQPWLPVEYPRLCSSNSLGRNDEAPNSIFRFCSACEKDTEFHCVAVGSFIAAVYFFIFLRQYKCRPTLKSE